MFVLIIRISYRRQVIVIDWDPNSTKLHPENTLNIDRWLGNDDDMALFDLVAFLNSECEQRDGPKARIAI